MRIILIRHGQTDENKENRYLGHFDSPLNSTGREQVEGLAESLKKLEARGICYSSDLLRAVETSKIICHAFSLDLKVYPDLRELHFGDWDCHTYDELNEKNSVGLHRWISNPFEYSPPNGETLTELGARVDRWVKQIIFSNGGEDCLVVSHGGPIRWILSKWLLHDESQFWNVQNIRHGEGLILEVDVIRNIWKHKGNI
ncbi:histidine phosphatase family protein [Schinkia azotoformans]|uniref:histidine phosphatase family protein n=1 Tax=Schinkia azotoformans TaxID=1454 RepID=UPI002DBF1D75|nr:histidine phosphatase family protein [Schinkia azotoformans]MEC1721542.1 histidine phosphatase family protein [Schinkia azotoformans]MED4413659.1 histidine phosphatase family protein [Schinkia azotoformans]